MKFLLFFVLAQPSQTICDTPSREAEDVRLGRAASICVVEQARRLEPSGERADLIAQSALSRCQSAYDGWRVVFRPCHTVAEINAMERSFERALISQGQDVVIDTRARRRARRR